MKKFITTAFATLVTVYGYSQDGTHLPLTGGTLTGNLTFSTGSSKSIGWGGHTTAGAAYPLIYSDHNFLALNSKAGSRLYFNFDNTNASSLVDFFSGKLTINKDGVLAGTSATFGGALTTNGPDAGFRFEDRTNNNPWYWYASGNMAYLYNGSAGNIMSIGHSTGSTTFHKLLDINMSENSSWATQVYNGGTYNAHGLYVNINSASNGVPFRVDRGGSPLLNIANNGDATFSGSLTGTSATFIKTNTSTYSASNGSTFNIQNALVNNSQATGRNIFTHFSNSSLGVINVGLVQNSSGYGDFVVNQFNPGGYQENFRITSGGNVGIGTAIPDTDSKLTVAGKIHSREVKVTATAGGADFVFEKDYNLKPLAEVAEFISENKHLPEIASAKEMEKNGLELGEMNIKLLQKVEELTLYLIEKDKQVNDLQSRLVKLENKVK